MYGVLWAAVIFMGACSSQGQTGKGTEEALASEEVLSTVPQRMQVSEVTENFTYRGKEYRATVVRRPDDQLPIVENEEGEKFVDNRVTLHITCGGKQLVDKAFTKESFASIVSARFLKYALLEGLVFDQVTSQGILFAASVCYPQSDLYVPIRLVVAADGKISMAKEELMEEYQPTDSIG